MQAKIIDRKWVVEWFDERQCYHMPSLTLADNGICWPYGTVLLQ